ncbi:MAG: hypothetical protein B6U72_03235 [Candidatus Altiarchaeales archaeon ex4484_2]|nr:MAG: hypothetical protein B6U72_03235 [Candidatus Altiarchaeales archaeon ex4484_2]
MSSESENSGFEFLKKKISGERGFNCSYYKESILKRRIDSRMRRTEIDSYKDYVSLLDRSPQEYNALIDTLTVNVTEFFRNPLVFKAMEEVIIPNLLFYKKIQSRKVIRVWSAGCASGEEPYSVAILFKEFLGDEIDDYVFFVTATDIDDNILDKAREGIYTADQMKNVTKERLDNYFNEVAGKYQVKDSIKKYVKFRHHDVISGEETHYFDLILCRNLLIYLSRGVQDEIFERFLRSLNPYGYLVIGKSETLTPEAAKRFELIDLCERIYRKPP